MEYLYLYLKLLVLHHHSVEVFIEPALVVLLETVSHVVRELHQGGGVVEDSAEQDNGDLVTGSGPLPLTEHLVQETID